MGWRSIADLMTGGADAPVALLGAPLGLGSVTPGRCDLAPAILREAARRISSYDLETGHDISVAVRDAGDVNVAALMPADAFAPIRDAAAVCAAAHDLVILAGGNNAVTRPAVHALGPLDRVGLITLDAHLDMRDTSDGLSNGNPVRALLEDGLPGANIVQIGLAPFANTEEMHEDALAAGVHVVPLNLCLRLGIGPVLDKALARLSHCKAIAVDFDIDVIDRASCPGAPGARPGGMAPTMFFAAARRLAAEPKARLVDLTELDPSLDVAAITALTAARWLAEILAGFDARPL